MISAGLGAVILLMVIFAVLQGRKIEELRRGSIYLRVSFPSEARIVGNSVTVPLRVTLKSRESTAPPFQLDLEQVARTENGLQLAGLASKVTGRFDLQAGRGVYTLLVHGLSRGTYELEVIAPQLDDGEYEARTSSDVVLGTLGDSAPQGDLFSIEVGGR